MDRSSLRLFLENKEQQKEEWKKRQADRRRKEQKDSGFDQAVGKASEASAVTVRPPSELAGGLTYKRVPTTLSTLGWGAAVSSLAVLFIVVSFAPGCHAF